MRRGAKIELNTLVFKSCTNYLSRKQNLERTRKRAKQKKNKKKWKKVKKSSKLTFGRYGSPKCIKQSIWRKVEIGKRGQERKSKRKMIKNDQKWHHRWCKIDKETRMILTIPVFSDIDFLDRIMQNIQFCYLIWTSCFGRGGFQEARKEGPKSQMCGNP